VEEERGKLLNQIEFYFRWLHWPSCTTEFITWCFRLSSSCSLIHSKENLCSDVYLRQQMDGQGWVDISLIAGFKKVIVTTSPHC
jgi:la-related protein 1